MPLLRIPFNPSKGVIISVSILTDKEAVDIRDRVGSGEEKIEMEQFQCLIDTGASISCISQRLSQKLNLKSSGMITMNSATDTVQVQTYFATLVIPIGKAFYAFESSQVAEYQTLSTDYDVLLGRDILMRGIFQTDWSGQAIIGF